MARIREIVRSTQNVRAHSPEAAAVCQYKVIEDKDGETLVHLSTFGSEHRQSNPKSSQSLQLSRENAVELMAIFSAAFGLAEPVDADGGQPDPTPGVEPKFRAVDDDLAESLYMPKEWLQECVDLIADRRQVILYGPPGTGKTFLAKSVAKHLCGGAQRVKVVQFHPTYSYEDFFEGFRPVETEKGQMTYEIHRGPLYRIAEDARKNPGHLYALIIDEINRGNLAKIFGELYYLLEYRDESINLLYSDKVEMFRLPKNVLIIGTMNRADRSVALIDSAMRRRFAFVHLHPSEEPVRSVLRSWLREQDYSEEVADLVDELNSLISDEDFMVGPSYFMHPSRVSGRGMDVAWRTNVIPLMEELNFDMTAAEVREQYALKEIERRVQARDSETVE